jgi:ornithine cyclodeaminase/alanine dehydrogenase-like protein (mu-crystallin family)
VRSVERVFACDTEPAAAARYADEMARALGVEVLPVAGHREAVRASDIVVTCTPSRRPLLSADDVPAGCFIAAVGADSEDKQELAPQLLARSVVVADVLEQCARIGDLHHALTAGLMRREDVHAELADVVSGRRPGRRTGSNVTVFDSTGTALEDVAVAVLVYERALDAGAGIELHLGA